MAYGRGNDYFQMFLELIDYSCKAAERLDEILNRFSVAELPRQLDELHAIEHAADEQKHVLMEKLSREFITPIEREDIVQITSEIDEITDGIEDVLITMYMFNIRSIEPEALEFCKIIKNCCEGLRAVFQEFREFRKSKNLHKDIIEVNTLEEVGDRLYVEAVRRLHVECTDPLLISSWRELFRLFERCCDRCENTANIVEEIIMKNT